MREREILSSLDRLRGQTQALAASLKKIETQDRKIEALATAHGYRQATADVVSWLASQDHYLARYYATRLVEGAHRGALQRERLLRSPS